MRGQTFAVDLALALLLLTFLVILPTSLAEQIERTVGVREDTVELQTAANTALDALLYSPGDPSNWTSLNCSSVSALGAQRRRGELDASKLARLADYAANDSGCFTNRLGLERPNFNESFGVYALNGSLVLGSNATAPTANESAVGERNAILNNQLVRLKLVVWITQ